MAKFLDTQGVSYYLKRLIDNSTDKLYLISPYLQLNNQLRLSLEDRHKFSIDIVMIYGKVSEINPAESEWLKSMPGIKLMFHKDLHAKCYFNEKEAIITSMNLYMFSQQNNVEMGIYVSKIEDSDLYNQIATEVDRIKRGSEHRTISVQKVENSEVLNSNDVKTSSPSPSISKPSLEKKDYKNSKYKSTSALSKKLKISSKELFDIFENQGWIIRKDKSWVLTSKGEANGGQMKNSQYGEFVAWPEEIIKELSIPQN